MTRPPWPRAFASVLGVAVCLAAPGAEPKGGGNEAPDSQAGTRRTGDEPAPEAGEGKAERSDRGTDLGTDLGTDRGGIDRKTGNGKDREDLGRILGDTPATRAVDRGVEYLLRSQLADGSWFAPMGKNTGVVSLATLALLSTGGEPSRGRLGPCIDRALAFVLRYVDEEGILALPEPNRSHGPMYEHGIATLLLGEVLGMTSEAPSGLEHLTRVHRESVNLILRAQAVPKSSRSDTGGWRYFPNAKSTDSDISVTGWQVLALRSAQNAGLAVPRRAIDQAVAYVRRCRHPTGGFGYMCGAGYEPNLARTGTGILILELCGAGGGEETRRSGDWILGEPLEWHGPFVFYSIYYATQAMWQLGGKSWETWKPRAEKLLLANQREDGSWPPVAGDTQEASAGPAYSTALAILSLTVDYKYLPIYQR
jgi:hypothetical protein